MKIQKFTYLNDKLLHDWSKLWEQSPSANMVNSPAWFNAARIAFGEKPASIIALYDDLENDLIAIAALVKEKIFAIPVWTVPGGQFADKNSILVDFHDEEVIKILLTEISKLGNVYLPEYTSNQLQKIATKLDEEKLKESCR